MRLFAGAFIAALLVVALAFYARYLFAAQAPTIPGRHSTTTYADSIASYASGAHPQPLGLSAPFASPTP